MSNHTPSRKDWVSKPIHLISSMSKMDIRQYKTELTTLNKHIVLNILKRIEPLGVKDDGLGLDFFLGYCRRR